MNVSVRSDPAAHLAAMRDHLSRSDLASAEAAMARLTDADLLDLDIAALWQPFRDAGFTYGEARIAPLFKTCFPDNLFLRLLGVNAMIQTHAVDAALAELTDIAEHEGAFEQAAHFFNFFARLDRFDLAAEFSHALARSGTVSHADQVRMGFDIAEALHARSMTVALSRHLEHLAPLCTGALPLTLKLADLYMRIGATSFALHALDSLPEPEDDAPITRLYRQMLTPGLEDWERLAALRDIAAEPTTDSQFWLKVSFKAEDLHDNSLALDAARNAYDHAPAGERVWAQYRLAQTLAATGQQKAAVAEIAAVLTDDTGVKFLAQNLADLAIACGQPGVALLAVGRWLEVDPDLAQAHVMGCVYMRRGDDIPGLRGAADRVIGRMQAGMTLTGEQCRMLIDSIRGLDAGLETTLARLAAAQHPDDAEFRASAMPDTFAAKFMAGQPGLASATPKSLPARLLERLWPR